MMKRNTFFTWLVICFTFLLNGCSQGTYLAERGNREAREGKYDSAIRFYDKVLKINPNNSDIYYNRGLAWVYKGEVNKAISDFTKALEIKKDFRDAYHNRGLIYNKKGNYDLAISDFSKALQFNPDNFQKFQLLFNRGFSLSELDYYEKAIEDYTEAIKIHKISKLKINDLPETYYYRAEAWYGKGNLDNAILDYTIAIQKNPSYDKAILHRADRLNEKKDYASSIIDYEKAIELNPKNPVASNNYSWFLSTCPDSRFRNGEKALSLALKTIELKPNEVIFLSSLAAAYAENRNFGKAIQIEEEAISLIKDDHKDLQKLKDELKVILKSFRSGKPWREEIKKEGWMKKYKIQ